MKATIYAVIRPWALAQIFGVGEEKVEAWIAEGLPVNADGSLTLCRACRWLMARHKEIERRKVELSRITQRDLVTLTGLSRRAVLDWSQKYGCPRNDDASYNLNEVIRWLPKFYDRIHRERHRKAARQIEQIHKLFSGDKK